MLIPLPHQDQPLEKSSKGTIIRRAAESRFEEIISSAYDSNETDEAIDVADQNLPQYLTRLIQTITGQSAELNENVDLFSYGVDSIACMQLRTRIRPLLPNHEGALPMSIIEDCGTIQRLTDFVLRKRHGESETGGDNDEQLMLELVKEYGSFEGQTRQSPTTGSQPNSAGSGVVVLTGATGALGAYILDLLQTRQNVDSIYCLVRGSDEHAARERVSKALKEKGLANLLSLETSDSKVKVVPAKLSEKRLGLDDEVYEYLAREVTSIIHVAWTVNFRLKLRSFVKDNVAGVRNLLDLALHVPRSNPPRYTYCSSTAAILNCHVEKSGHLPEALLAQPSAASPLGYSQSKWVAEHICLEAHARTSLHGLITVVRVGQLAGDAVTGVWNTKEAWPMMLSTARLIQCLPDLGDEPLDWLPVDIAAQAFLETTQTHLTTKDQMPVYHVLNPHRQPTWHEMLQWLKKKEKFDIVSPKEWVHRLEESHASDHSAMKLLGLWKEAYASGSGNSAKRPQFSMVQTEKDIPALRQVKPLDEAYIGRIWDWVQKEVR